jgi:uncharacterized protein (TIGR00725 family)
MTATPGDTGPGTAARPPYVAICGPASAAPELLELARTAGRLCAERGWVVVTGGLGGVMAAAADGVASMGGTAIALLPGDDRSAATPGHTVAIATGMGEMRNALLVRSVDAVLAIGGSWGTLSEIALAARSGVPVVTIGIQPIAEIVETTARGTVTACASVDDAVAALAGALGG